MPQGYELPDRKQNYLDWTDSISELLTEEETAKIKAFIENIPERRCFLHGDFHAKNIMLANDEFILIDIGDAAYGHPIFDIATQVLANIVFPANTKRSKEEIEHFLGFDQNDANDYWGAFCCTYFDVTPDRIGEITKKYLPYAFLLMSYHASVITGTNKAALKPLIDTILRGKCITAIDASRPLDF